MGSVRQFPDDQCIQLGDICVIYISEQQRYRLKIEQNAQLQTKFGLVKANDLLNHPYGTKFECKRGWVIPLRLTPELWTQLLPHRTQILYQADISMILLQLDIKPGSTVIESGTGSGSLSHAILRSCRPSGFLYTFDINESRVEAARQEFKDHGLDGHVRIENRNVCEVGFGDELKNTADACILDLPRTWDAIEHAYKALKSNGSRLCTFSPCIEQVQQNVAKMTELKLKDIVTMECLIRPFEIKTQKLRCWDDQIMRGLVAIDQQRYENLKDKADPVKRVKISANDSDTHLGCVQITDETKSESLEYDELDSLNEALNNPKAVFNANMVPKKANLHAKQVTETVSHSGFLTFASKRL